MSSSKASRPHWRCKHCHSCRSQIRCAWAHTGRKIYHNKAEQSENLVKTEQCAPERSLYWKSRKFQRHRGFCSKCVVPLTLLVLHKYQMSDVLCQRITYTSGVGHTTLNTDKKIVRNTFGLVLHTTNSFPLRFTTRQASHSRFIADRTLMTQ